MISQYLRAYIKDCYPRLYAKITGEYTFARISDRPSTKPSSSSNIPKKVYQTWEYNILGSTHYKQIEKFRDLNPEFDFIFFDSKQRDEYMEECYANHPISKVYKSGLFGPLKADIWRYCILCERGGAYFDIDAWCRVPLRSLFSDSTHALISFENNITPHLPSAEVAKLLDFPHNNILNWTLFYEKGHPFLQKVIENIVDYYPFFRRQIFDSPKDGIVKFTGPLMLTKSIHQALEKDPEIPFEQAGIDLNGLGEINMKGDWVRLAQAAHYSAFFQEAIVD